MQFGSVFKMKPKAGKKQALIDLFKNGRQPGDMKGFLMAHVFDAGDDVWGVAVPARKRIERMLTTRHRIKSIARCASYLNQTQSGTTARLNR